MSYPGYEIAKHCIHMEESNGAPLPIRICSNCGYHAHRNQSTCPNCYWVIEGMEWTYPSKEGWEKWDKISKYGST